MPPSAAGSERYAGIHWLNPHQPNIVQAFMSVTAIVRRPSLPRNTSASRLRPADAEAFLARQRAGSSTRPWTHTVISAGSTPTKNTARHPQIGMTTATTSAASPYPTAHALCMKPSALPRCSADQVSDTSAAPLAHVPPIPSPRNTRKTASWATVCAKPHAAVNTE